MLSAGADLAKALSVFKAMFGGEPRTTLMALGYFKDGDVGSIAPHERQVLTRARDRVRELPKIVMTKGSLVVDVGPCDPVGSTGPG